MRPRPASRGSMLIIALGILTLLSIMAVTFYTLMHYEKGAADNYRDGVKAKFIAFAGYERAVAEMRKVAKEPLFGPQPDSARLSPFVYGVKRSGSGKEVDVAHPVEEIDRDSRIYNDQFFYGTTGASYKGGSDEYRVKIVDTGALFDMNFPLDMETVQTGTGGTTVGTNKPRQGQVLELMLDALGVEIAQDRIYHGRQPAWDPINGPQDPVSKRPCVSFNGQIGTKAILSYRVSLDGQRFTSKSQLAEIMEEASFKVLADYITVNGSTDPKALQGVSAGGTTSGHSKVELVNQSAGVRGTEGRPVINMNLASKPLLVAAIAPIAGRRFAFYMPTHLMEAREAHTSAAGLYNQGTAGPGFDPAKNEEVTQYDVHEGFIYVGPFGSGKNQDLKNPEKIADWIIQNRPYKSYADFHEKLRADMRRGAPELAGFMPPHNLLGAGQKSDVPGTRIFPPANPADVRLNIFGITGEPYYQAYVREAGYSLLMANFCPAFIANTTVPNAATYMPVDKGSLVYPDDKQLALNQDGSPWPRQTFDMCTESRGVYEITSLGQIRGTTGEIIAQEKYFTSVRLLGTLSHRSQYDFEDNDATFEQSLSRSEFATYPNPRRLFASADPTAATPHPQNRDGTPSDLACRIWGHVECSVPPAIESGASCPELFAFTASGGLGTPLFFIPFDWYEKGMGPPQKAALQAYQANRGDKIQAGTTVAQGFAGMESFLVQHPFNRARGNLPMLASGPIGGASQPRVDGSGNLNLYADGLHLSNRMGRDYKLWYRAGAKVDKDNEQSRKGSPQEVQGALPPPGTANPRGTYPLAPGTNDPLRGADQGNVWYRKGAIGFWYKPDFDWSYQASPGTQPAPFPLYCGYLFASRVYCNPGTEGLRYGDEAVDTPIHDLNDPPDNPRGTPSDGTELFLYRTPDGRLRATRLFYRVVGAFQGPGTHTELPSHYFDPEHSPSRPGAGPYGNKPPLPGYTYNAGNKYFVNGEPEDPNAAGAPAVGAITCYKFASSKRPYTYNAGTNPPRPAQGYPWPPLEFAKQAGTAFASNETWIKNARTDAYVDYPKLQDWKAGEWHHIAVYWDDTNTAPTPDSFLRIYVDGAPVSTAKTVGKPGSFSRVNEPPDFPPGSTDPTKTQHFPKDQLQVGCIERYINESGAGVFKHANKDTPGATHPDPVAGVDPRHIWLFACGVIDDVVAWDGQSTLGPNTALSGLRTRFKPGVGSTRYAQDFDLSAVLPPGAPPLELARLSWTVIPAPPRTQSQGPVGSAELPPLPGSDKVKVWVDGAVLAVPKADLGWDYTDLHAGIFPGFGKLTSDATGRNPAYVFAPPPGSPAKPKLRYHLALTPASYQLQGGASVGSWLDTPAVLEMNLTYVLPAEETLLKERVID